VPAPGAGRPQARERSEARRAESFDFAQDELRRRILAKILDDLLGYEPPGDDRRREISSGVGTGADEARIALAGPTIGLRVDDERPGLRAPP